MKSRITAFCIICLFYATGSFASKILIPMDADGQTNHLKAYGIAFAALEEKVKVDWLLNYRGGSYAMENTKELEALCIQRGVSYTIISNHNYNAIIKQIKGADFNGAVKRLNKAPKIAIYTPPNKEPWDDAVTMALTYAGVPFEKIYVDEVLAGNLDKYDWVHLHHEDFTGQYGKFYSQYSSAEWYKNDKASAEALAARHGFKKVSQMQLAVVKKLREFVVKGGNMFAMCSATETFDIAIAADGIDICAEQFDGDPIDMNTATELNYTNCFAFQDFSVVLNPYKYQRSNIDNSSYRQITHETDYFYLYSYPAKSNVVPAMLCQNHTSKIAGFMGQTTGFRKEILKPGISVMGMTALSGNSNVNKDLKYFDNSGAYFLPIDEARYIHGDCGKGTWTFYGGHDPEDYQHMIGDKPTDLNQFPHSPGYRLILNNILYPAAQRDPVPTVVLGDLAKINLSKPASQQTIEGTEPKVLIYPNPTNNEVVISYTPATGTTGNTKINHIVVMNVEGKVFLNKDYDTETVQLEMKDYPSGMYLIQVNGVYSGNVIKN